MEQPLVSGIAYVKDGAIHLPVQDCSETYGGALNLLRIVDPNPGGFHASPVDRMEAGLRGLQAGARPSVILLDLHTPEMDGLEFRRRQTTDPAVAGIPVIVLTADLDKESEARQLGVSFYLKKPVPFPQLVEVVAHFAGRPAEGNLSSGYGPDGSGRKG